MDIGFKKALQKMRHQGSKGPKTPADDWRKLVVAFLVLNVAIIGGSIYLFLQTNASEEAADPGKAPKIESLNQKGLDKLNQRFKEKHDAFGIYKFSKPTNPDPSI